VALVIRSLTCVFVCLVATIVAVAEQGVLAGKITDGETGDGLRSASISVVEAKKGAYSDPKGNYKVKKIPAGTYTVRVSYVGYDPKVIEKVVIADDKTVTVNVVLQLTKREGQEVVVTADRINDNAAALLAKRKNATQVSDGIGREEISKLPDSDAGQALKRVSGVTLVEGKYVFVRGTSDRYSNTTLNGAALTSTEPDKKSFAFDMFPSELLESANVVKSFTPDLPGNFAGGLVQLNTIDFPAGQSLKLSGSQGGNSMVTLQRDALFSTAGGSGDALALGASQRSLPVGFPVDRPAMNVLRSEVNAGISDPTNPQGQAAIGQLNSLGRTFNNNLWGTSATTAPTNGSLALTYTDVFSTGEEDQLGIVASANYGTSWQNNEIIRAGVLSNLVDRLFEFEGISSTRSTSWSALGNIAYKAGSNTTLTFKNAYNRSADIENVDITGENFAQGQVRRLFSFQYVEKSLYSGTLGGEHTLIGINNALLDWKAGYSYSTREEPDFRRLQFFRQTTDVGAPLDAAFDQTQQGSGSQAGRFFSNLNDEALSYALNFALPITPTTKVKVGGVLENRSRQFAARSITMIQGANNDITNNFRIKDSAYVPDLSPFFADSNYDVAKDRLSYSEDSKLSDRYDAQENLVAAYAMVDMPIDLGVDIRVIAGARLEQNIQKLNSFNVTDDRVQVNQNVLDVLPAINVVIKPTQEMNVRVSAAQTLARPSLREFAPFQFFDFQTQAVIQGNPNLRRSLIQNYDLRWELFPGVGEVVSVGAFYKRFQNAIEETLFPQQSEIVRSFANAAGDANNYGVEFEIRKSLGFMSTFMEQFVVSINASLINSSIVVEQAGVRDERTMWGQSPYSINLGVYYANPDSKTQVTLGYNRSGSRIIQVGLIGFYEGDSPHVFELPRDVIDFSVIQPFGNLELKLAVRDLLNQPLRWEQSGQLIQSNIRGTNISLGFGYKL
jgi:outer membrane receptor protein involved in Fe transport